MCTDSSVGVESEWPMLRIRAARWMVESMYPVHLVVTALIIAAVAVIAAVKRLRRRGR